MYSPKVNEKLIPAIYRRAKIEKKPMTKVVEDILSSDLFKVCYCHNCNNPIEVERGTTEAYCDKCESLVFLTAQK